MSFRISDLLENVSGREEAEDIMREDPFAKELDASYHIIKWDPIFGDFR